MRLTPHKWADQQTAAPRKLQALLHALASFANPQGLAYPSQETIARRLGWSKGTIKKWSDVGRALGLFSVKKRFNPSKGHVDGMTYTLHLDRVITSDEATMQIANLRFPPGEANRKNGDFPLAEANRKNEGGEIATGGKQLQEQYGRAYQDEGCGRPAFGRWPCPSLPAEPGQALTGPRLAPGKRPRRPRHMNDIHPEEIIMDITPSARRRFPSGSRVAVDFPPARQPARTLWIDGECLAEADALIGKWQAGQLSTGDAAVAIAALEYGSGK